ncbi:alpha/beta fold hydrolase [Methylovirgula sp. HY1]|uniref:alpha/beta fold hydrolase n=1 Tax=Methylovirgula sp. HY1 TaxID=2822761 RepID=UPI001C5A65F1|nr:alpha/beta hydrolase [Methylovirgula sp. HY1]QXX73580.1 2-(acetamidomethylene)succinate hydrolase [Methylovirgula sp. HY1]
MFYANAYASRFLSAPDGLQLHMRDYGAPFDPGLPVVCLPGLSRNAADFGPLAAALAAGAAGRRRRVIAIDYRGRGRSEHDRDWRNYSLAVENADIVAMLIASEISEAIFIGTSRGGLHIMALAARMPTLLRGAVLNDIGPAIDSAGLTRIRLYLRHFVAPTTFADSIDYLKKTMSARFAGLSDADFELHARASFERSDGSFGSTFDPDIVKPFEALDLDNPPPPAWALFDGLADIPLLAIRGANSDILSAETLAEMARRHSHCETYIVSGQGHAPLLYDEASIDRIADFVRRVEDREDLPAPTF